MKTRLVVTVLLLGMLGAGEPLLACGEKFRMASRLTRFQQPPRVRVAASILIYANPALNLPKALAGVPVDATLRKVGYRPTTVTNPKEFQTVLDRGGWDLVLLDVGDSSAAIARSPVANPPVVLPVAFNPSKAELAAAKKQHPHVLKGPVKSQSLVEAIDEALAEKPPTQSKINSKSGL
jgi:CheY-like chemotaxis protein